MITPSKEFWEVFKNTNGALSCTEAVAIMNIAAQAPNRGTHLEAGTYMGKSAMAAIIGLSTGDFYLLEPDFSNDRVMESETHNRVSQFNKNVTVHTNSIQSIEFIPTIDTYWVSSPPKYSYVFIDSGSHQDGLPMQEVKLLEDRMVQGGIIAFHDWASQFVEVKEAADYLVGTGKYEYIPIDWDKVIEYVNENNLEEGNKSWHHNELRNPCFVGALKRK